MSKKNIAKKLLTVIVQNSNSKTESIKCNKQINKYYTSPLGSQFRQNVRQHWLNFCTSNQEIQFFTHVVDNSTTGTFTNTLNDIKSICSSQVPVGLASVRNHDTKNNQDVKNMIETENIYPKTHTLLQSLILVSPLNSRNLYFQWQRQRKIWWSRFSVSPGHFSIQDDGENGPQNFLPESYLSNLDAIIGEKSHSVHIALELDFRTHFMEEIELFEQNPKTGITMMDESGTILPNIILSTINLDAACLGLLEECLDENENLILHHKLAPFQYRIVCDYSDVEDGSELQDLARFLCALLRKSYLHTLLVNNETSLLNDTFEESDKMGIPYCLVLRKDTLINGFVYLRNRDTTLEEQLHVSDVPDYLVKLCKNY